MVRRRAETRDANPGAIPRRTFLAIALFLVALAGSANARAEDAATDTSADITDLPLETLLDVEIYSASRFAQKASASPSSARVITAAEIRAHGWRTLAQALASLPGLFTNYDRAYTVLGARGFLRPGDYDSRFLLLVDGVRVNDPVYDQAPIGTDFVVDMALVERIEYVPGPGSATFGSNAFFGVINIITRNGRDVPGAEAGVQAGSYGDVGGSAQYAVASGDRDLLLSASREHVDGATLHFPEYDSPATPNGVVRCQDGIDLDRFFVKANAGGLSFTLAHASQEKGDPTAGYGQLFADPRSRAHDARTLADVAWRVDAADDLAVTTRVFAGRYDYLGSYVYAPAPALNQDTANARWYGASLQGVYTSWSRHTLVVGLDAQRDARRDLSNYDIDPFVSHLDYQSTNTHIAPFVEDEFAIRDDLKLDAGLRYDRTTANGADTNPRLALVWTPTASATLKALVGRAFRAPNAYESAYADMSGNTLDSERIRTAELVWSQRFGLQTTLTTSVFRYDLLDLINEVVEPITDDVAFVNAGHVRDAGFEIALDHVWQNGAALRASYGYADVTDLSNGDSWFENAPHHLFKVDLTAPLGHTGLLAGAEARYVSARLGETASIEPYTVVDLTLTWPVVPQHVELAVTLQNLFDTRYGDPPGPSFLQNTIEQDGRTFLVRASYRF